MSTATKVKVDELVEIVKSMTMIEVSEFVKKLEEEFGVSSQMPVMAGAAQGAAATGDAAEAPAEQTEFTVILQSAGSSKIPVIKEVRAITGLGLKDTKELVEAGGKAVKENIPKEEAEQIKKKLEAVGATVELK